MRLRRGPFLFRYNYSIGLDTYILSLLGSITRFSLERDSAATASTVLSQIIQCLSTITLALVERLLWCRIVVLVTEKRLSSSLSALHCSVSDLEAVSVPVHE